MVKGLGKIAISPDHSISNVFLVDFLDYNLLFVSQLCKMGYNCLFTNVGVTVFRRSDVSPGNLFSYVLMIVVLSLDGHAILCVITRAAPLITSGQVDLVLGDGGVTS